MNIVALLLLVLAAAIAWRQRRAAACPAHRPWAGPIAWSLCGLCCLAGAALLLLPVAGVD